eukprot:scaffold191219_cov37-Tisochrysis_lutea.AAC.2
MRMGTRSAAGPKTQAETIDRAGVRAPSAVPSPLDTIPTLRSARSSSFRRETSRSKRGAAAHKSSKRCKILYPAERSGAATAVAICTTRASAQAAMEMLAKRPSAMVDMAALRLVPAVVLLSNSRAPPGSTIPVAWISHSNSSRPR